MSGSDLADKFGDDYKGKYAKYKQLLNSSKRKKHIDDNIKIAEIFEDLKKTLDAINLDTFDQVHKSYFLNEFFPQIVKILINQK